MQAASLGTIGILAKPLFERLIRVPIEASSLTFHSPSLFVFERNARQCSLYARFKSSWVGARTQKKKGSSAVHYWLRSLFCGVGPSLTFDVQPRGHAVMS
jgi:hypothetical protein